jgi:hypothetical protein
VLRWLRQNKRRYQPILNHNSNGESSRYQVQQTVDISQQAAVSQLTELGLRNLVQDYKSALDDKKCRLLLRPNFLSELEFPEF